MRLVKEEEKKICEKYGAYDETGHVHCFECPLRSKYYSCECKRTLSAKEWKEELKDWKADQERRKC